MYGAMIHRARGKFPHGKYTVPRNARGTVRHTRECRFLPSNRHAHERNRVMRSYNGFTASQRQHAFNWLKEQYRTGTRTPPVTCDLCAVNKYRDGARIDAHSEDYRTPYGHHIGYFSLCFRCHMLLHGRFRNQEISNEVSEPAEFTAVVEGLTDVPAPAPARHAPACPPAGTHTRTRARRLTFENLVDDLENGISFGFSGNPSLAQIEEYPDKRVLAGVSFLSSRGRELVAAIRAGMTYPQLPSETPQGV